MGWKVALQTRYCTAAHETLSKFLNYIFPQGGRISKSDVKFKVA